MRWGATSGRAGGEDDPRPPGTRLLERYAEVEAMKREGIEFMAWWFPGVLNDEAKLILGVIGRHRIAPQLWITGGGEEPSGEAGRLERIEAEARR